MSYKIFLTLDNSNNKNVYTPLMEKREVIPGKVVNQEFEAQTEEAVRNKIEDLLNERGLKEMRVVQDVTYDVVVNIGEDEPEDIVPKAKIVKVQKAPVSMYMSDTSENGYAYRNNQDAVTLVDYYKNGAFGLDYKKSNMKAYLSSGENLVEAGPHEYVGLLVTFDRPVETIVGSYMWKDEDKPARFKYYKLTALTDALDEDSQTAVKAVYPSLPFENTYIAWIPVDAISSPEDNNLGAIIVNNTLTYGFYNVEDATPYENGMDLAPKSVSDTLLTISVKSCCC